MNTKEAVNFSASIMTRNPYDIESQSGNLYRSLISMSKRSKQITLNIKDELQAKLTEFATTVDNLEEVFENREQIEISRYYERLPKPTSLAIEEFLDGRLEIFEKVVDPDLDA